MGRCLAAGTFVRTPSGDVRAEDIWKCNEIVTLRDGIETVEAIKWVGQRHVDVKRHPRPELIAPVRIRANAIAEGAPVRDLLVSPEHAIYTDGVLVQARALVNGGSVIQERATEEVTYYHVELESHGVFFAEGLTVESYLDNGDRTFFESDTDAVMLHPALTPATEFDVRKSGVAFAPFVTAPEAVEPIWRRIAERSAELGYSVPELQVTQDADLHILADGKIIRPIAGQQERYTFVLPAGVQSASLVSRFAIPVDLVPYADDPRRLGVAVKSISIKTQDQEVVLPADFPKDANGWYDTERSGVSMWRWTDGAAELPLSHIQGSAVVTVVCRTVASYPVYDERAQPARKVA